MKTKIVHIDDKDGFDVFIGRPMKWGNPFVIGKDGDRNQVIEKFREWVTKQPSLLSDLEELRGKRLGCFCHPKKCHGEVYLELLGECGGLEQPEMF